MGSINRFEDIRGWQEARKLVRMIYGLTNEGALAGDFGLRNQLQRAAVSVMANIAEGFDCNSQIEFSRFLGIARRSAVEVQSLLYAALDVGYIDQTKFDSAYEQARLTKALVSGLKRSLNTISK